MADKRLSQTAMIVLTMVAEGHSYEQILAAHPELTYTDIFSAAREAVDVATDRDRSTAPALMEIRGRFPRAYEKWTAEEDDRLRQLARAGKKPWEIAATLERQASAIESRRLKLGIAPQRRRS